MNTTKPTHTPGPWGLAKHSPKLLKVESAKRVICDAFAGAAEDEANALLIASAPDLLAALRDLVANQEAGWRATGTMPEAHIQSMPYLRAARAAIAKATAV